LPFIVRAGYNERVTVSAVVPGSQPSSISHQQFLFQQKIYLAAGLAGYGGTLIALSNAWYKKLSLNRLFHFFNDNAFDWLQMDKVAMFLLVLS
jgi:hypothetical protein